MARFLVSNGYKQQSIVPFGTYRFKMRDPALKCWATLVASLWDKSPTSILSATSSLYPRRYVNLQKPKGRLAAFLNRGSSDANESLAQHFTEWRSRCPENLRPFVARLAAVFVVKL
jgi:hypothetical protein